MEGKIKVYRLYGIYKNHDGSYAYFPLKFYTSLSGAKKSKWINDSILKEFIIVPCSNAEGETKYFFKDGIWTTVIPNYAKRYWNRKLWINKEDYGDNN